MPDNARRNFRYLAEAGSKRRWNESPRLAAGKAGEGLRDRFGRLRQRSVELIVIDIEAAGLSRVPWRLRENLDAAALGAAEIHRPRIAVRDRLGAGVRQIAHLLVNPAS